MSNASKSSVAVPTVLTGHNGTLAPPMPNRDSQEHQATMDETDAKHSLNLHSLGPSRLSRESLYQGSSRPPSRPAIPKDTRPRSQYPDKDFRNSTMAGLVELKTDVMCNWLHQQQVEKMWSSSGGREGVVLKKARDEYMCCPKDLQAERDGLFDAVRKLHVKCAMTVNTRIIKLFLRREDLSYVPLEGGLRLQILSTISQLPQCQKHHFAAFIQDQALLIVWDDDPNHIVDRIQSIEDQLIAMIWKEETAEDDGTTPGPDSRMPSRAPSTYSLNDCGRDLEAFNKKGTLASRQIVLIQPILTAFCLVLIIAAIGSGWRHVAIEIKIDNDYIRLAFIAAMPLQCWLGLFFMQTVVGCVSQMIGPISQMTANTKFFSGQAPPRLYGRTLPHVTVQCPVYKEGLWSVIDPTVKSIKAAISTYEMQGGTANIFINDDGMQVLAEKEAQERRDYYDEHSIGWVARPKHNPKPKEGEAQFLRAGKFKKASNMNYALKVSARVEDKLSSYARGPTWSSDQVHDIYGSALAAVITENECRTWAAGNVRLGDYILLIDSDTRVPVDCFLDAVSEMELSPQVAILQFSSGVMNVTTSWFEKGITFFTNLIYSAIQYAVSNGDVAPFVGHNAFLRWSAVQDVAYTEDGTEKYWSEATVSEDFDLALRLQTSGYILRLAAYANQGFKEGVSLTIYDELARWEKYAYGCSELIFHPFKQWLYKGPFTPLFLRFLGSNMPLPSKLTIMAYVGTYFAIGSAWILTLLNYFLVGWFNGHLDHYYIDSFKIYFAIVVVFNGLGNLALAVLRYRTEEKPLFAALRENFTWVLMLTVFLGGLSLHVSQAILSHLCSVEISWGATSKEASDTSFFAEVPVILRKFRCTFLWCLIMTVAMVVLAGIGPVGRLVPYDWQIGLFTAVWPLATVVGSHALLPLVLNPGLMQFTF